MKIDIYVVVYNEEVILPYFLRHYEKFANRIFAFVDNCTDSSREILSKHPKVVIFDMVTHGLNEGYWTNQIWTKYEELSRGKADFVMCVDADEFVYHSNLIQILEQEKAKGTQIIRCDGFTMFSNALPTTTGQIYEEVKDGVADSLMCKSIVFDPQTYIRFKRGKHYIQDKYSDTQVKRDTGIKLLHYRYFGRDYFENKDKRNFSRYYIDAEVPNYDMKQPRNLPDGTKGNRYEWFERHKAKAINVVDYV